MWRSGSPSLGRAAAVGAAGLLLLAAPAARAVDVDAIVLEAAVRQREGEVGAGRVRHERIEVETQLDSTGKRKKPERHRYSVLMDGRGLVARELLEVDGRPATDEEKAKSRREDEKRKRASLEADGGHSVEEELVSGRVPLLDLYHRLRFRLVGEEVLDGRPNYVVEFLPRPGLVARTMRDRVLNGFAGRAWIDVAENQVRKIEGHLTAPVHVLGGILLDLQGVRLDYESREVLPGSWAPCREEIGITAKAGLLLDYRREIRFEFSGYRGARPDAPLRASR